MKTKSIYSILIALCSLVASCDHDSIRAKGEVTTEEAYYANYTGLNVSDAFNVYVRFSETEEKIEIEANENLHEKIIVRKEGNTLTIKLINYTTVKGNATLNVYITTKNITDFDISGASNIILESELIASNVEIKISGASEFTGELNVDRLEVDAHGASDIDLFGSATAMDADLTGSSSLKNYDFSIGRLDIELTGASDAFLTVTELINIDATGASSLNYKGDAVVNTIRLTGSSEIIKK